VADYPLRLLAFFAAFPGRAETEGASS